MGNNCSSKICKTQRKNIIVEFIFSKVVNQKSEALTNMKRFLNVFWGILQNFLKLSKKIILTRSCFQSKYLGQNYHFHCENLTNYNWNQCHFHCQNQRPTTPYFFCNNNIQSFRSVIVSDSSFLSLGSFICTGSTTFAYLLRQLITVIPQRDESSSFLFTFPTRYTWITLLHILIQCTQ